MSLIRSIAFISLLSFASLCQAQNGWTRKAKSFYLQGALATFNTNKYYNVNSVLNTSGATFHSHGFLFYGEYGVIDQFNIIVDVPLLMLNYFSDYEIKAGLGNLKLGLKYRFFKTFPFALQVDFEIPTDDGFNLSTSKSPDFFGNYNTINVPTSDGEFNVWTTLAASHSVNEGKTFGSIYFGTNWRTKGFSHQLHAGLEIGQLLFDRWYLIAKFKIQEKLIQGTAGGSIFWGEGTTFSQYNFTSIVKLNEHWNILAGASDFIGFPIKRRNIYDGANFYLGVSLEY